MTCMQVGVLLCVLLVFVGVWECVVACPNACTCT